MKTCTNVICDKCDKIIEPNCGFIIQGNIYAIKSDINVRAGIIGNAFPITSDDDTIFFPDVKEYAYHYHCLNSILKESINIIETNVKIGR